MYQQLVFAMSHSVHSVHLPQWLSPYYSSSSSGMPIEIGKDCEGYRSMLLVRCLPKRTQCSEVYELLLLESHSLWQAFSLILHQRLTRLYTHREMSIDQRYRVDCL